MKYLLYGMLVIVVLVVIKNLGSSDCQFSNQWANDATTPMLRTLVKNKVHGCATYRFTPCKTHNDEYLFQCSQDGEKWKAYLLWPQIEKITVY